MAKVVHAFYVFLLVFYDFVDYNNLALNNQTAEENERGSQ